MFYSNNPYFRLYTVTIWSLCIHTLFIFTVYYQKVFQTHSCEDVHLHLFGLRFCKLFGCEQNIKRDKEWILNYFCLCQLTPESFGITNTLYAGIRKCITSLHQNFELIVFLRVSVFPIFQWKIVLRSNNLHSHLSLCCTPPPPPFSNALCSLGLLSTAWLL